MVISREKHWNDIKVKELDWKKKFKSIMGYNMDLNKLIENISSLNVKNIRIKAT